MDKIKLEACPEECWHDATEKPDHGEAVIAEYHEYDDPARPAREHVVWWWEDQWRTYPNVDDLAYVNRWRRIPSARPTPEPSGEVIQADRDAAQAYLDDPRHADGRVQTRTILNQAFARHRLTQGATLTDQRDHEGRNLLEAVSAAQEVQPYRGWNLTKLNAVAEQIRAHLGLPSVRDLNPEIAEMQDSAEANKDAIRALIAEPSGEERSTAGLIDDSEPLESWGELRDDPDAIVKCADRWRLIANSIGCTLHGFVDGRVASFVTPDGNTIEVGPKFRATLTPPPSDAMLREQEFNRGVLIAVSTLINCWGSSTEAEHLLAMVRATPEMVESMGFDDYDREPLLAALTSTEGEG